MRLNKTIRKTVSGLLVVLFALSVTPRIFLHNLVVTHKHNMLVSKAPQVTRTGFNCSFDNLVAQSPFVNTYAVLTFDVPPQFSSFNAVISKDFFSQHHFFAELRGPPASL